MPDAKLLRKVLDRPDETRSFVDGKGKAQIVKLGDVTLGRGIFEPGWQWSKHVKPIVKTDSCQSAHTGTVLEGRMRVRMNDGTEMEFGQPKAIYAQVVGRAGQLNPFIECVMLGSPFAHVYLAEDTELHFKLPFCRVPNLTQRPRRPANLATRHRSKESTPIRVLFDA